ncbi:YhcB family protein [Thiohalobacter sp. IOR34]|uniref:YhcB family protein n=1 Tax=Thiohalobacter sp. IOR34 TaxID=3057176 RepID=UPI0025B24978|nr:YhcB family protein [Thiohalobacter sp. IOR34]WJW76013.1 YhcB family protein [Thiohalobacter sp. IOR34]
MIAEDAVLVWSIIAALAVGTGVGFLVAALFGARNNRSRELEEALEQSRAELQEYRGKVNAHFQKTAQLFEDMSDRYRAVYQHLASSSQELCGERPPALQQELPSRPRLEAEAEDRPPEPAAADLPSAQTGDALTGDGYLGDAPHVPELNERAEPGGDKLH